MREDKSRYDSANGSIINQDSGMSKVILQTTLSSRILAGSTTVLYVQEAVGHKEFRSIYYKKTGEDNIFTP